MERINSSWCGVVEDSQCIRIHRNTHINDYTSKGAKMRNPLHQARRTKGGGRGQSELVPRFFVSTPRSQRPVPVHRLAPPRHLCYAGRRGSERPTQQQAQPSPPMYTEVQAFIGAEAPWRREHTCGNYGTNKSVGSLVDPGGVRCCRCLHGSAAR